MIGKFAFLALIAFAASQGVDDARCPKVNTRPPTHIPNETDCTRYYLCHNGQRHAMPQCPPGTVFNVEASACQPGTCDDITTVEGDTTTVEGDTTTDVDGTTTTVPGPPPAPTSIPAPPEAIPAPPEGTRRRQKK
jgi:hypothetical protein